MVCAAQIPKGAKGVRDGRGVFDSLDEARAELEKEFSSQGWEVVGVSDTDEILTRN